MKKISVLLATLFATLSLFFYGCGPAETVPIPYTLQKAGKVSINIYDGKGRIVRELLHAEPRKAGQNRDEWDGRDSEGAVLPPGAYSWKLLATPGLRAEYLMSVGGSYPPDPNGPWWAAGIGTHGGPATVAVDETGFYVSAFTENIEASLIKQSLDGKTRLWSAPVPGAWDAGWLLAVDGDTLYSLTQKGLLRKYEASSGKVVGDLEPLAEKEIPTGMDAAGGVVLLSFREHNAVRWLDAKTGDTLATRALDAPGDVALAAGGDAFVISGDKIVRLAREAPAEAQPTVVIAGLASPQRLSLDRKSRELLVIEAEAQQVMRFSPAGALLATYGKAGGRGDGLYTPEAQKSFAGLGDVAATPDGGFWVAEPLSAPRRVARFDRAGVSQQEWYGGQSWAPWFFPEPGNPSAVWINSQWGSMMRCVIDYKTRTWKVHSTYQFNGLAGGLIGGHANAQIWEAREHGGQLYLCRLGTPIVVRVDKKNWKLVPVVVALSHIQHYKNEMPPLAVEWSGGNNSMLWTDKNGDGLPQREEAVFYPIGAPWGSGAAVDEDFSYYTSAGRKLLQYPVTGWNAVGAPLYSEFPAGKPVAEMPADRVTSLEGRWGAYFFRDVATGETYAGLNEGMPGWGESKDTFLLKWNPDGTLAWQVGRKGSDPGETGVFRRILGMTHGCIALTNFSFEWSSERLTRTYVWDKDGLWVGKLMDNPKLDGIPAWRYALGGEALAGTLYTDPKTGEVLLFGNWLNEGRIYRITGWDGWERAAGKIALKEVLPALPPKADRWAEVAPGTGTGLAGEYWDNTDMKDDPFLKRLDADLNFTSGFFPQTNEPVAAQSKPVHSARWTGQVQPLQSGAYSFQMGLSGVGTIWVDGKNVYGTPAAERNSLLTLQAGRKYDIRVEYSTRNLHPSVKLGAQLMWVEPSGIYPGSAKIIPQSQLYPAVP